MSCWDKFLHIGAVTIIVNNRDHTLHYVIEEEILNQLGSRLLRTAVGIISKGLFLYKRHKKALNCMVSTFRPWLTLTERKKKKKKKKNVLRLGQNATDLKIT